MRIHRVIIVLALSLAALTFTMCCKQTRTNSDSANNNLAPASGQHTEIKQGITGHVEIWEGNFMPVIDEQRRNNKITPGAGRRVRVHEPVRMDGGLAAAKRASIPTPVVAEVMADSAGHFQIAVPPGTYSIFVEVEGGWYYNGWNDQGVQGAVTVEPEKTTDILIKVTEKATF